MPDDVSAAAQAVMEAAKDFPELEARVASLEARMKQVESFLGHIHPAEPAQAFQEYPKAVGSEVAYNAAEEAKLRAAQRIA